jgi:hypothetical protein
MHNADDIAPGRASGAHGPRGDPKGLPRGRCGRGTSGIWQPPSSASNAAVIRTSSVIARNALTIDAARVEVDDLCHHGDLTREEADRNLAKLG